MSMTQLNKTKPLNIHNPISPLQAFSQYCSEELERRSNSGAVFDPQLYKDAVELASLRLRLMEEEGMA